MVFQVTTNGGPIRSGVKNGIRLVFTLRQNLPSEFTRQIKTQTGYMIVAGPELTALDVVAEESKVGGLSRAAEVLVELCENTSWDVGKSQLIGFFSSATIQRLGYLLEKIEFREQADSLYALFKQSGKTMRKIPLKQTVAIRADMPINKRWKIIENYKYDIDEI